MKTKKYLLLAVLFFSTLAHAELNLDTPENLLTKAAIDRQQLRDVVLSLEQQLPEMRDVKTFESYFFMLDQLKADSDRLGLDDLYPDAVASIGVKMASFGVKWADLSTMNHDRLAYYLKWMNVDALANLMSYTAYYSRKLTDETLLNTLSTNVDFIIQSTTLVLKDRFDVQIGYRDLSSTIAVKFLLNPNLTDEQITYWANKIYTSQGLSVYTDQIQKKIYSLNTDSKKSVHGIFSYLKLSYDISDRLIDSPLSYLRDRVSDLTLEVVKKSFEVGEPITANEITYALSQLDSRHLQSLTTVLTSMSEPLIYQNSATFIRLAKMLTPILAAQGLVTENTALSLYLDRIAAATTIDTLDAEGTYEIIDKTNQVWKFTIIKSHPFEIIASLSNESWSLYQSYFSVKYSTSENLFTASNIIYDTDASNQLSVVTFKLTTDHKIIFTDVFGSTQLKQVTGNLIQKLPAMHASARLNTRRDDVYEGDILFGTSTTPTHVQVTLQSDGVSVVGRIKDNLGVIYDFTTGYFSMNKEFSLTSGKLKNTSWAHMRGTIDDQQLKARIMVGGKGFVSNEFILKRKSL